MRHSLAFCLLILSPLWGLPALAQQDHAPAPMIGSPAPEPVAVPSDNEQQATESFRARYLANNEPRIALLWGREFDDKMSEWVQTGRRTVTGKPWWSWGDSATTTETVRDADSGQVIQQTQRKYGGRGDSIARSDYTEARDETIQRGRVLDRDIFFEFEAGYITRLNAMGVRVMDRSTLMRIMARDQELELGTAIISDYVKVETDALRKYSDYIAEIIPASDSEFMITVKDIESGRIVTMFKSSGQSRSEAATASHWQATERGFRKVTDEQSSQQPQTLYQLGEQLAVETMVNLANSWQ